MAASYDSEKLQTFRLFYGTANKKQREPSIPKRQSGDDEMNIKI